MAEEFVDISGWQSVIDWDAHYRAGYRRASIKATEGNGFIDPQFSRNASETGRLGFQRIFYGYARPDLGNSPEAEADWLWQVVSPYMKANDALECDLEAGSPSQNWLDRYVARLQSHAGAGTYSGNWFMNPLGLHYVGFSHVASYGNTAPAADVWQYTSSGSVPGIAGNVDMNRVLNPAALAVEQPAPAPAPKRRNPDMVIYQAEEDGAQFPYNGRVGEQLTPAQSAPLVHAGVPVEIVPRAVIDSFPKDGPLLVRGPDGTVVSPVAVWRHIPPSEFRVMLGDNAVVEQVDQATVNGLLGKK